MFICGSWQGLFMSKKVFCLFTIFVISISICCSNDQPFISQINDAYQQLGFDLPKIPDNEKELVKNVVKLFSGFSYEKRLKLYVWMSSFLMESNKKGNPKIRRSKVEKLFVELIRKKDFEVVENLLPLIPNSTYHRIWKALSVLIMKEELFQTKSQVDVNLLKDIFSKWLSMKNNTPPIELALFHSFPRKFLKSLINNNSKYGKISNKERMDATIYLYYLGDQKDKLFVEKMKNDQGVIFEYHGGGSIIGKRYELRTIGTELRKILSLHEKDSDEYFSLVSEYYKSKFNTSK